MAVVEDVDESLRAAGVENLVIVNGHGGNYVLRNVVQQATTKHDRMALFPSAEDWNAARVDAGCETGAHEDMHGGELEVSLLLHGAPDLVREGYQTLDHEANQRPDPIGDGGMQLHDWIWGGRTDGVRAAARRVSTATSSRH